MGGPGSGRRKGIGTLPRGAFSPGWKGGLGMSAIKHQGSIIVHNAAGLNKALKAKGYKYKAYTGWEKRIHR